MGARWFTLHISLGLTAAGLIALRLAWRLRHPPAALSLAVAGWGVALPDWAAKNDQLKEQLFQLHPVAAWALVGLVAVHVLAALKHLIIDRDGVFDRMRL